jgi:hypothetical protein
MYTINCKTEESCDFPYWYARFNPSGAVAFHCYLGSCLAGNGRGGNGSIIASRTTGKLEDQDGHIGMNIHRSVPNGPRPTMTGPEDQERVMLRHKPDLESSQREDLRDSKGAAISSPDLHRHCFGIGLEELGMSLRIFDNNSTSDF